MYTTPFLQEQLDFMLSLMQWRNGPLDSFFIFLNFFDTMPFTFLLLPTVWLGLSWRWGIRLFYGVFFVSFLNYLLKMIFQEPRPFTQIPELALLKIGGYSFPSGAAQMSIFLGALLIYVWKSPFAKIIGILYPLLIGFSRIYLGVHYPSDVLAGYVVGISLFTIFILTYKTIEKSIARSPIIYLLIGTLLPIILGWLLHNHKVFHLLGSLCGVSFGIYFALQKGLYLSPPKKFWQILARAFIGISGVFILYMLLIQFFYFNLKKEWLTFIEIFFLSLWIALAASPICVLIVPKTSFDKKIP